MAHLVWLRLDRTPDGQPFYGGTYFPPLPCYGIPSFVDVLHAVLDAWRNRRPEIIEGGEQLVAAIERQMSVTDDLNPETLNPETMDAAFDNLSSGFDRAHGGWGGAPKFPQPMVIEFLLRYHHTTGKSGALEMVTQTLEAMARGGMYDQLGGGFHRYSVDDHWLVPHFEKMLYDNAQLARVYLHAWQVTGEPFYRTIVEETLDYVVREMTDSRGGFYSTQDADSEGEEGKFFIWTPDQIQEVLGDQADRFVEAYAVTERGNFEGQNILELTDRLEERDALADARRKLFEAREGRVHPGRDDKVLTSWNGLMLAAFAEAARVLERDDYREVAERSAEFLLSELITPEGRLHHTWKDGVARVNESTINVRGYLEDYTHLIEGLLELYQTAFAPRWYLAATELAETMIAHFSAPVGFFDTSDDHEALITRPRDLQDNAIPSGNAMAAFALLRLAGLAVEPRYLDLAQAALGAVAQMMSRYPLGFAQWLIAAAYALSHPREVAIVGDPEAADTQELLGAVTSGYRPHQVLAVGRSETDDGAVPLLQHRTPVDGRATVYVCIDRVCGTPVTGLAELRELIG